MIFYLSAQKSNLLKNKLLCIHFILTMLFLRLQRFQGKSLSRDNILKSPTVCNGWGTICPGEAAVVLIFTHHLISLLFHISPLPHSPIITEKMITCTIPSVNCLLLHLFSGVLPLISALTWFQKIMENSLDCNVKAECSHVPATSRDPGYHCFSLGLNFLVSWRRHWTNEVSSPLHWKVHYPITLASKGKP